MNTRISRVIMTAAALAVLSPRGLNAWPPLARVVTPPLARPATSARVTAGSRYRILILFPKRSGTTPDGSVLTLYHMVRDSLVEFFPCAAVWEEEDIAILIKNNRDNRVASSATDDLAEFFAGLTRADLIVSLSFAGDKHVFMSMLDPKGSGRPLASSSSQSVSVKEQAAEIVAPLRGLSYSICPWLGSIEYEQTSENLAATSEPPSVSDGSSSVYSTSTTAFDDERWTFRLVRRRMYPVRIETEGSAKMESTAEQKTTATNKNCFFQDASGTVRDNDLRVHVSDELIDRQSSTGLAKAPLLSPKVQLTKQDEMTFNGVTVKVTTWTLAVEAGFMGSSESKSTNERRGGCGSWKKDDPAGTGPGPYGRLISFLVDGLRGADANTLAGKVVIADTKSASGLRERETVKFNLTRR